MQNTIVCYHYVVIPVKRAMFYTKTRFRKVCILGIHAVAMSHSVCISIQKTVRCTQTLFVTNLDRHFFIRKTAPTLIHVYARVLYSLATVNICSFHIHLYLNPEHSIKHKESVISKNAIFE